MQGTLKILRHLSFFVSTTAQGTKTWHVLIVRHVDVPTRLPKGRLVGLVQRAQLKVLQNFKNTHLLPPSPFNVQVSQTVFPFSPEHLQSCLASEVIYLRCGHKRRTKSKKTVERKAEESKQTQTPVKCLSSLYKWRPLSAGCSCRERGGRGCLSQVRPGIRPAAPPSSVHRLWSCEETLPLWWQPSLYKLCLQTPGVLWWHLERARDS